MRGVRCAGLRHGMDIQLAKHLGCTVTRGASSLRSARVVRPEVPVAAARRCPSGGVRLRSLFTSGWTPSPTPAAFRRCCSRFSRSLVIFGPKSSSPRPCLEQNSSGFLLATGSAVPVVRGFSSGSIGCVARVALSPRVTSFLPDKDWVDDQRLCPGCGVEMQDEDPKAPGFFQLPAPPKRVEEEAVSLEELADGELELFGARELRERAREDQESVEASSSELDAEEGFPEGVEPGSRRPRRNRRRRRGKGKLGQDREDASERERPTVCARCHALRNYGMVKDESVENLLPDFDFDHVVGDRLRKAVGRRSVVLMVIDAVDFDGSFPKTAAAVLADAERELGNAWREGKAANVARLVIVLNKADLLPGQMSPIRLEQWVRRRARAGGVVQISGVHIVSAFKGWGVGKLYAQVKEMAGPVGEAWVIGAQNVGKSSLINALGKVPMEQLQQGEVKAKFVREGKAKAFLTEAPIPGTTIGVLKLSNILPGRAKLLDTPGLLHPHQITTRLTREEQKMVQIRKILKPRTFRVKVGHAVTLGGLMRVSVETAPAESIYATVWASAHIPCHLGKAGTAQELFDKHVGDKLQPPSSRERAEDLGHWVARTVDVEGDKWNKSSMDVAVAGVGWIAFGLSGTATLGVWTFEGVAVTVREAMVLDLAPVMERPGFTAVKTKGKNAVE